MIFQDSHLNVTNIKTRYLGERAAVVHARMHLRGQIIDALNESPWGALFGVVKDKYGKIWMLDYTIQK